MQSFCGIVMKRERQSTSGLALAAWGKTNVLGVMVMPVSEHGWGQAGPAAGCQARRLR
jgi:hypothetical protein